MHNKNKELHKSNSLSIKKIIIFAFFISVLGFLGGFVLGVIGGVIGGALGGLISDFIIKLIRKKTKNANHNSKTK